VKNSLIINNDTELVVAVEALDKGGIGFLSLIDSQGMLIGILTDGDIRRAFLQKKYDLDTIINKNPEVMKYTSPQREIIARLKRLHRRHMPLVDEEGKYREVFSLDDIEFVSRDNPVVIMAGGLGSRLGELTKDIPKPMLTVGKRPMLQHLVEMFSEQGFRQFIFCVNYKKEVIQDYFKDGKKLGVKIDYIEENERLGTAGALSLIDTTIEVPLFVINADVLTNINLLEVLDLHIKHQNVATMCVREYRHKIPYGVVRSGSDMEITSLDEKPELLLDVNAGVYLIEPSIINYVPKDEYYDMPTLFEKLIEQGLKSSVYRIDDYWLDIGREEDLNKANTDMQGKT
jgi:dTDP-glucose pyrophosphorylase